MRFSRLVCGALIAGTMAAHAEACSVPADYHSLLGPYDAIHHADWIGLAVAVRSADGSGLELEFREYLKGDGPQSLPVSYPRFVRLRPAGTRMKRWWETTMHIQQRRSGMAAGEAGWVRIVESASSLQRGRPTWCLDLCSTKWDMRISLWPMMMPGSNM